jgi:TIR domain/Calcineurin-like phosphoesterase
MRTKEQVVILHLSDLHFGWEGDEKGRTDRKLALDGLFRLLGRLNRGWKPDCVCISGDIGWAGRRKDYEDAKSWVEQLLNQLELLPECLFMCPGNHDVNRNVAQGNARPNSPEEADRVLGIPIQEHYLKPFEAYTEFCKAMGTPPYELGPNESYLVGCRSFRGINFVAYNSAWSSKGNDDEGKLWLGLPQIGYMEKETRLPNPEQIADWPPIIAVFHHPSECFHPEERHAWKQRPNTFDYMARRCHLFFTGHIHAEPRDADKVGGGGWHLDGGATFAGASHFNFFRIVQVKADRFVYRTFEYDPRSADNVWHEKGKAKPLGFKALSQKGKRKDSSSLTNGRHRRSDQQAQEFVAPARPAKNTSPTRTKKISNGASNDETSSHAQAKPGQDGEIKEGGGKSSPTQTEEFAWDVFISYSHTDADIVTRIRSALGKRGVRVWIDKEQILPGDLSVSKMEDGLERSSAVAIMVSPASMDSGWVEEEYSRAISLTKRVDNPVRVIPILIKQATLPGFLANRSWVDFEDQSLFDANIDFLVKGIKRQADQPASLPARSATEKSLLTEMTFLWFFPEGMLSGLYKYLIAKMGLTSAAARAEQEGLVRALETNKPDMKGADPERVRELGGMVKDPAKTAKELLSSVKDWIDENIPFDYVVDLGIGRALLVRDLLTLAKYLTNEDDGDHERREWVCQLARIHLPLIAEDHLRIGVEISESLLSVGCERRAMDDLMYAHLLLRIGEARRAADIFEAHRGNNLFNLLGLDERERFDRALDWAKATKDAGRARQMHDEILSAYDQMLELLHQIKPKNKKDKSMLLSAEADVLNNRATQIAQFGENSEWARAQKNFIDACDIYQLLKDNDRLLATRANFVAQSLDRSDRQNLRASDSSLRSLLKSLENLDDITKGSHASEELFFFFYQKARLLKRLYPGNPARAIEYYERASQVALRVKLTHRSPIAQVWVLRLQSRSGDISEEAYLEGLQQCAASLKKHTGDAWASRTLGNILLDIARVLRNRAAMTDAWNVLVEAFEMEIGSFAWSQSSMLRLKEILRAMDGLRVEEDSRALFLEKNEHLLSSLTDAPRYETLRWSSIADWLNR